MLAKLTAGLDRLPTVVRDFVVAFVATSVGLLLQAVVEAGGVTDVAWSDAGLAALNAGAVAAAAVGLLAVTKLTTAYGRGARDADDAGHAHPLVPVVAAALLAVAALVVAVGLAVSASPRSGADGPAPSPTATLGNKSWAVGIVR